MRDPTAPGPAALVLRRRIGWYLVIRLALVTAFLAGATLLYAQPPSDVADPRVALIALGYGVTAIAGLLLPRVPNLLAFAGTQLFVDLLLVSLAILVTGGLESPLAILYNLVILNAALLRLGRGITLAAVAAAVTYGALLLALAAQAPPELPIGQTIFGQATVILSFLAVGLLARYLTAQLATAEHLLAERQDELGRIAALQRLLANTIDHGLIVTDAGGRITSLNPTAGEILGHAPAAALGQPLATLLPGAALLSEANGPTEFPRADGAVDGARLVRVKVAAVTDTFQRPVGRMYVVQDVTTLREMEERLREQERVDAYASAVRPLEGLEVSSFEGLIGESEAMRRIFALVQKVAPTDSTVLVTGESGTGKELVARAIHRRSPRADGEFVPVNCGAIPETLVESELFGHVRGAFTGAVSDRPGLFRQAHRGTIFLDEIGELPFAMQVRLLRVLQDRQVTPVGGSTAFPVDVRVVAATNRDLERQVAEGRFREDLYYRLNVIRIETPPLRDRPEDVPLLLLHLLRTCSKRHGKTVERVSPRTMRILVTHAYPGNVRELENLVDHAVTLCDGDTLTDQDLPQHLLARSGAATAAAPAEGEAAHPALAPGRNLDAQLEAYEKEMLLAALDRAGGVRKRAAELLGIKYRSLRHRLSKYGLASGDDECDHETAPSA